VDIFDITLFAMLRIESLRSLGVAQDQILSVGQLLFNFQMAGMLVGGLFFGILGDKSGRLRSLFASIILYSVGNLANAFVTTIPEYALCRFISGVGLAGELGLGITLVAEILPKETRGIGTAMVATVGVLGAVVAGLFVEVLSWRQCYIVGGSMGILLLFLRLKVLESGMYEKLKEQTSVARGSVLLLFKSRQRISLYILCVLVGLPIWYVAGIVMALSPEIANELGVTDPVLSSRSIAISYIGLAVGDLSSGLLSQLLKSRKKVLYLFEAMTILFLIILFQTSGGRNSSYFYILCFLIGVGAGFWALFITISAEQFGTNLRATVATTVPNLVRASLILMSILLLYLKPQVGLLQSAYIVGIVVFSLSLLATYFIKETFGKDLNYLEGR